VQSAEIALSPAPGAESVRDFGVLPHRIPCPSPPLNETGAIGDPNSSRTRNCWKAKANEECRAMNGTELLVPQIAERRLKDLEAHQLAQAASAHHIESRVKRRPERSRASMAVGRLLAGWRRFRRPSVGTARVLQSVRSTSNPR